MEKLEKIKKNKLLLAYEKLNGEERIEFREKIKEECCVGHSTFYFYLRFEKLPKLFEEKLDIILQNKNLAS